VNRLIKRIYLLAAYKGFKEVEFLLFMNRGVSYSARAVTWLCISCVKCSVGKKNVVLLRYLFWQLILKIF